MDQLWQECETNLINKEVPPMYLLDIPFQRYLPCFNTWIVWKIKNKGSCCVLEISLLTTFLHYWTLPLSNNLRQNTRFWVLPPNHPSFNPHNKHVMLSQTPYLRLSILKVLLASQLQFSYIETVQNWMSCELYIEHFLLIPVQIQKYCVFQTGKNSKYKNLEFNWLL